MSRYDGLIIPRSYSEYINKTDAATLQQALQLSGVLSGAVAAGDNKAVKSSAVNDALANYEKSLVFNNTQSSATYKGYWNEISIDFETGISIPIQNNYNYCSMKVSLFGSGGQAIYNVQFDQSYVNIVCISKSDFNLKLYGTYQNNKLYLLPLTTWGAFMYITDIKANKTVSVSGKRFSNTLYTNVDTYPTEFTNEILSEITDKILDNYKKQTITTLTNEDLNEITTNGYYAMFNVDSIINKPSGNNMHNNLLEVIEMGSNRGMQKFYSMNTQQAFIRFWYYSGSAYEFTTWKQTTN